MKKISFCILTIALSIFSFEIKAQQKTYLELLANQPHWVDSVFNKLNRRARIAQMFFVRAHTNLGKKYADSVGMVIKKEHLGGVVFFQGGPMRQAQLINNYQKLSKVPLLITADGEWGLGMRLDSTVSYPYQMALGAIQNKELIYKMGLEVAKDFKRIGMQMNLAPDADVNNNPKNPVINYRSFGENKYNVALKAGAYMKGMQDGGLLTTLKHFPGHGDTDVDSHYDLPQLNFSATRLDTLEMYPFKELIKQSASGIMIAHMNIPSLDNTPNLPSTLSKPIVTDILKKKLGFKGLIVSDAMDMKGVVKYFKDGEADLMAVIAGNDILELSQNSARGINLILKAVKDHRIDMKVIDESVRKILTAKYWASVNNKDTVVTRNLVADLNRKSSAALVQELANASVTLLRGKAFIKNLIPIRRTAIISIGVPSVTVFQKEVSKGYYNSVYYVLDKDATANQISNIAREINAFDQVIVGIHDSRSRPANDIPLNDGLKAFIKDLSTKNTVFALFANPYNLAILPGLEKSKALIVGYQKEDFMQISAAAVINNRLIPTGKLPVSVLPNFKYGDGM
ncbi:glycoside hydrolase family 3 [Pedobacter changchengzhani]|uniref:beta-N-acetylhexosaminidase n=1 Tax=Pedobacter changchengzhani TaxID=2529274 RepID=A0A4R5MP34_9SPHI|nr:glycoside hydrolase family 3 N-terminal domain-containing protein [Pedobacter changchengzhani]TDG37105.1 glycoside hydrolase family 3 [Pedobacter changchengzhani]